MRFRARVVRACRRAEFIVFRLLRHWEPSLCSLWEIESQAELSMRLSIGSTSAMPQRIGTASWIGVQESHQMCRKHKLCRDGDTLRVGGGLCLVGSFFGF
jgi:hypothetical protein